MSEYEKIVNKFKEKDAIARLFGIEPRIIERGHAKATMTVNEQMVNGQNITHGAAVFALVDVAFAVASNSHNRVALALNMNINYLKPTVLGDTLTANAVEDKVGRTTGLYRITVEDQKGNLISVAEGLVYRFADQPFVKE